MSATDRFDRLIAWYPAAWRERYGEEMIALLEDTHGTSRVRLRHRLLIAKAGSMERARSVGLLGDSAGPGERLRAGSLVILSAWALFMVAGGAFAKFTEHWGAATPSGDRWIPSLGYSAVAWAGIAGGALVLCAGAAVVPGFVRLVREGGWTSVRRPVGRSLLVGAIAVATTTGMVMWAHHVGPAGRNGGSLSYKWVGLVWLLTVFAALATATMAAAAVARRMRISRRVIRLLGTLALALFVLMAVVLLGTILWWAGVAEYAPGFLGRGLLSTSNIVPPVLVAAGTLMVVSLAAAAFGTIRVAGAIRDPVLG